MDGNCETCVHWTRDDTLADIYNGPIGNCAQLSEADFDRSPDVLAFPLSMEGDGWFLTRPNFGCVLWEPLAEDEVTWYAIKDFEEYQRLAKWRPSS